ncbi:Uncharacterised protein [Mycobacteroides abscessus subsp. abscessus]|nr:Uncharacterised protein [Mycobacteroides abscessus subsp. abscessus]
MSSSIGRKRAVWAACGDSVPSGLRSLTKRSTLSGTLIRAKCWPPVSGTWTVIARFRLRPDM